MVEGGGKRKEKRHRRNKTNKQTKKTIKLEPRPPYSFSDSRKTLQGNNKHTPPVRITHRRTKKATRKRITHCTMPLALQNTPFPPPSPPPSPKLSCFSLCKTTTIGGGGGGFKWRCGPSCTCRGLSVKKPPFFSMQKNAFTRV